MSAKTESLGARRVPFREVYSLPEVFLLTDIDKYVKAKRLRKVSDYRLQIFGIKDKPVKYHCCDCKRKLKARSKTPEWRKIPADQKRCGRCSARHRGLIKWQR